MAWEVFVGTGRNVPIKFLITDSAGSGCECDGANVECDSDGVECDGAGVECDGAGVGYTVADVVGDGTYVGYEAGRDGGGGRSCIVAVQGDQARWFKELWFEKQYKI
ncbi:hypothetical protein YC2023_087862 [Brassica napus]